MHNRSTDYVAPSVASITAGTQIKSADIKNLITSANGVNTVLNEITDNQSLVLTAAGSPYTLTQNRDVNIFCNTTAGPITVNLPLISGNKKSYCFTKLAGNSPVNIVRAGANLVDNPWFPQAVPANAGYIMYLPGETVELFDDGTYWRAANVSIPNVAVRAGVNTVHAIGVIPTFTTIRYNNEYFDQYGNYNPATYTFTAPVPGIYAVSASLIVAAGASSNLQLRIFKNGGSYSAATPTLPDSTNVINNTVEDLVELNYLDTVTIGAAMSTAGRNTLASPTESVVNISLIKRTL